MKRTMKKVLAMALSRCEKCKRNLAGVCGDCFREAINLLTRFVSKKTASSYSPGIYGSEFGLHCLFCGAFDKSTTPTHHEDCLILEARKFLESV